MTEKELKALLNSKVQEHIQPLLGSCLSDREIEGVKATLARELNNIPELQALTVPEFNVSVRRDPVDSSLFHIDVQQDRRRLVGCQVCGGIFPVSPLYPEVCPDCWECPGRETGDVCSGVPQVSDIDCIFCSVCNGGRDHGRHVGFDEFIARLQYKRAVEAGKLLCTGCSEPITVWGSITMLENEHDGWIDLEYYCPDCMEKYDDGGSRQCT